MVFLALGIRFDEVDVPDLGLLGQTSRFLDSGGFPVEAHDLPRARGKPEGQPPRTAADVEPPHRPETLGLEQSQEPR